MVEPANEDNESDTNECIQDLEEHLAATSKEPPNPVPQNPQNSEPDSGVDETPTNEPHNVFAMSGYEAEENPAREQAIREEVLKDSEDENQGIEEVHSSSSSQDEISVDPSNFDVPKEADTDEDEDTNNEHNNNKEKPKFLLQATNRHVVTNKTSRQIIIHQVPVRFPGNLMEDFESISFITDALVTIMAPEDLPGDVIVSASLRNRLENKQRTATVVLELDTEERRNKILKRAKERYADTTLPQAERNRYYITAIPPRIHTRNMSYSDEEVQTNTSRNAKIKKAGKKKEKRAKEKKRKYEGTPIAGTSKKQRVEPETAGPINAVSTPRPNSSKIDPNIPIEALAEIIHGMSNIEHATRDEETSMQVSTLDTSKMDMAMTIEVENEHYTPAPQENPNTEQDREECLKRELDLVQDIELMKRRILNWNEDLRRTMRGQPGPSDPRNKDKDLRSALRQKSGPTDLRNSHFNREQDMRAQMRREPSLPPTLNTLSEAMDLEKAIIYLEKSIINKEHFLGIGIEERRKLIQKLKATTEDSETSEPGNTSEEGELEPSEDEFINVRYSESDNSMREPETAKPMRSQQLTEKEKQLIRNPKPGPSGTRITGTPAAPMKNKPEKKKGKGKCASPIKYPKDTPIKNNEEVPLSMLIPRRIKPPAILDLRTKIDEAPATSEPKLDSGMGPVQSRISCKFPPRQSENINLVRPWLPWTQGNTPKNNPWLPPTTNQMKYGTAHHSRSFIEGKSTSRNEGSMTERGQKSPVQENEEPRVSKENDVTPEEAGDEVNDRNQEKEKRN